MSEAKEQVEMIAEEGRINGDDLAVEMAGNIWTVSDSLKKAQDALSEDSFSEAKSHASLAADISRQLQTQGGVSVMMPIESSKLAVVFGPLQINLKKRAKAVQMWVLSINIR